MFFGFGRTKPRKRTNKKGSKKGRKPPARLIKMCKRYGIKSTKKVGKHRVYKSKTVLKRQLKRKIKHRKSAFGAKRARKLRKQLLIKHKIKKSLKGKKKSGKQLSRKRFNKKYGKNRIKLRRFRFGDTATNSASFNQPEKYGYNQGVQQVQGNLSQSSQVVTPSSNMNRPPGFGVDPSELPIYGVYRPFFTEKIPTQIGPNSIGFEGQADGTLFPIGGPFARYTSFGKRRRRKL